MKKIAVTGATGFIGSNLVGYMSERVEGVKCLVRDKSKIDKIERNGVEIISGDLKNLLSLSELVQNCDTVYHLAAHVSDWGRKDDFFDINYSATKNLLDLAKDNGVRNFVYLSTSSVLWRSDFWNVHRLSDIDESYPYPDKYNDYYNESKAMAEKLVIEYNGKNGLKTVVIRPSGVWGAGDTVILPRIIKAALKGVLIPAGDGKGLVSPCHVKNLVEALYRAAVSDKSSGKVYFINDGISINHIHFIQKLLLSSGIQWKPKINFPYKLSYTIAALLEFLYRVLGIDTSPIITRFAVAAIAGSRTYSIHRAVEDLNFKPEVSIESGMQSLREWVDILGGYNYLIRNN